MVLNKTEKPVLIQATRGHALTSPEVLLFEVGNALSALIKRGKVQADELTTIWDAVACIPMTNHRIDMHSALQLAARFRIFAYDAYHLECALERGSPLLTLDRGMQRVARALSIEVLELNP